MNKFIVVILAILVSGCVTSQYHAVGTPSQSIYSANRECAWSTADTENGAVMLAAFPFGALGGAIAGAASSQADGPTRQQLIDKCMQEKGWQKN
ncbi:MAG: hypothetical protein KGJ13_09305 [Patescibacteria group bacterium]|nr:hypothetical protein [Patescibacteria group bacterium]